MRSTVSSVPDFRTAGRQREVLRTAVRQLERAELYLAAVAYMELGEPAAVRALTQIRTDTASLRRHLVEEPSVRRS